MKDLTFLGGKTGPLVLALGIAGILFTMAGWWWDVIIEAQSGYHNALVRHGLTIGMILFIASEVMFFVAWFWAFFASSLGSNDPQIYGRQEFTGGFWPPKGTEVINPLSLPLMNTFVLVASSFAVNVAHDDLREGHRDGFKNFLLVGDPARLPVRRRSGLRVHPRAVQLQEFDLWRDLLHGDRLPRGPRHHRRAVPHRLPRSARSPDR